MKQAYLSIVTRWSEALTAERLAEIDAVARTCARMSEIVVVADPLQSEQASTTGMLAAGAVASPVSIVVTWHNTSRDAASFAGLARAAGDFVLEWNADPADLTRDTLEAALEATDRGTEIVELVPERVAPVSRLFFMVANAFRRRRAPLQPSLGRLFSRRGLDSALIGSTGMASRTLLAADMGLPREVVVRPLRYRHDHAYRDRWGDAVTVLTRGTNAARVLPALAAVALAVVSLGAAVFAAVLYVTSGRAPEGWTTLVVIVGLGMSAILVLLTLIWEQLQSDRSGSHWHERAVSNVVVVPPFSEQTTGPDGHRPSDPGGAGSATRR